VLLHRFGTIDEYDLHGRGRAVPAVGAVMAVGALLLAAVPPFTTFMGKSLLDEASSGIPGFGWLVAVYIVISAVTGGSVLRVAGRVFVGWGASEGPHRAQQAEAAEEEVSETVGGHDHTPPLMVIVPAILLVGVLVLGLIPGAVPAVERYAAQFVDHRAYAAWVLHGAHVALPELPPSHISAADYLYGALSTVGAVGVAAAGLFGHRFSDLRQTGPARPVLTAVGVLRGLHSGHIGDYIAWWSTGVSVIGGVCLIALR
jgi:multicomponent Na+:H+ antiporter subunit D